MDDSCILVEFMGIPYSWKTSTMNEMQRQLRGRGVITHAIQEFRGSDDFYRRRKYTPEVNMLRSFNFMSEFIQVARDGRTRVVLVDRGLYDTQCWLKWFSQSSQQPRHYAETVASLISLIPEFASRYRVVWMDRDPVAAFNSHGSSPGNIVTHENLSSLRTVYEAQIASLVPPATSHSVNSDSGSAQSLAQRLISHLKLVRQ